MSATIPATESVMCSKCCKANKELTIRKEGVMTTALCVECHGVKHHSTQKLSKREDGAD